MATFRDWLKQYHRPSLPPDVAEWLNDKSCAGYLSACVELADLVFIEHNEPWISDSVGSLNDWLHQHQPNGGPAITKTHSMLVLPQTCFDQDLARSPPA